MKKVYIVYHSYVQNGCSFSDSVAIFENKSDALAFAYKYNNPHIYFKPLDFCCGSLYVRENDVYETIKEAPKCEWIDFDGFAPDELIVTDANDIF